MALNGISSEYPFYTDIIHPTPTVVIGKNRIPDGDGMSMSVFIAIVHVMTLNEICSEYQKCAVWPMSLVSKKNVLK